MGTIVSDVYGFSHEIIISVVVFVAALRYDDCVRTYARTLKWTVEHPMCNSGGHKSRLDNIICWCLFFFGLFGAIIRKNNLVMIFNSCLETVILLLKVKLGFVYGGNVFSPS